MSEVGFTSPGQTTQFPLRSLWLLADGWCEAISLLQGRLLLALHCLSGPRLRVSVILNTASKVTANGVHVRLDVVDGGETAQVCGLTEQTASRELRASLLKSWLFTEK